MQRRLVLRGLLPLSFTRCLHQNGAAAEATPSSAVQDNRSTEAADAGQKILSAVKERNFQEAQTQAAVFVQQQWREEYNIPAAFTVMCLVVWYWIAWANRSVHRRCAALEAASEKESREVVQLMKAAAEQCRSDILKASTDMKLIIAKNSELTADIDRMTSALRSGCKVSSS